ncbi:hypothetical protein I6E23_12840, partial [Prevotella brevis]|nr:hypothetical protein [Xylanibacter brevis]
MAFAAIVSFASCSSEDNNTTIENDSAVKVMTFTATQEGDEQSTRAAISTSDSKVINWEEGDKISLLYGSKNKEFTLTEGAGSTSGKFSGEALESGPYTAVYPYQSTASLSGTNVTNVTIPATQTATANSFDKNAALMMAQSDNTTLEFKNAVGYVKVTPKFACSKIELEAAEGSSDILAGKGTLNWNGGNPKINITEETSKTITLNGSIAKDISYYIVVPTGTLNRMWKITFTADDGKKYTRYCSKPLTIERNKIINIGNFATDSPFWADEHRGNKVTYEQEVDLGLTITGSDNKKYKVIFAKANLTANGLATNEYDYGDYFAWGATAPWCTQYTRTGTGNDVQVSPMAWENTQNATAYDWSNVPFRDGNNNSCNQYINNGDKLAMEHDAACQILGGEWQLPTKDIWNKLCDDTNYEWQWTTQDGYCGRKVTSITDNTKSIFLPAAGEVDGTSFNYVGSYGEYWSGTAYSSTDAYYLSFDESRFNAQIIYDRYCGYSVRPVRLVEVSAATTEGYNENEFNWE